MADIVVFDKTQPDYPMRGKLSRYYGMAKLGAVFNTNYQQGSNAFAKTKPLDVDEVVNKTLQDLIADPDCDVTYKGDTNTMSVKKGSSDKYEYGSGMVVKIKGVKDGPDQSHTEIMNIAVSEGNEDLLAPQNYLSVVIDDLGAPE